MPERTTAPPPRLRDAWLVRPLIEAGLLSRDQVLAAERDGVAELWPAAVARGWAASDRIVAALARHFRCSVADLSRTEPRATALLPEAVARRHRVVPLRADDRRITIATADPRNLAVERDLAFVTGRAVEFQLAAPEDLARRLEELYRPERRIERLLSGLGSDTIEPVTEPASTAKDPVLEAPVARLVDALVAEGVRERASDIHFDPDPGGMAVRYRIDGVLREVMRLPDSAGAAVVRRVKILAKLDVANPLVPADGRATARVTGKVVDLRVATSPVGYRGQKAVIRILDPSNLKVRLGDLGLIPAELEALTRLLGQREGIVLVTGPTGSGKTTTLYAAVNEIRTGKVNIVTVEDPVEYEIAGVSQIQVNEGQGLTFASILRSVLRQDPDILLLGEIRDLETAATAVQAGLTGHLVLSTLHTNDALSAVIRLRDMGLDAFKAAAVLKGVVAQRLIRRLCDACAAPEAALSGTMPPADHPRPVRRRRPTGCGECNGTGYRGRIPVVEILTIDARVARAIGEDGAPAALQSAARAAGMRTLWESGLERMWDGLTTMDELTRVLGERPPVLPSPARTAAAGGTPARILIADDDEQMRRLLLAVLAREGWEVVEARDGIEALERAGARPCDLILLDVEMPRLDGFGVLEELRARDSTAATPVIMLTTRAEGEARALDLGVQDFLAKPVQPSVLAARVRAALRKAKLC